ncbi:MAG: DHHA2 domain-containing protein [Candidatus Paceibacterota bacterium]
MPILITSYIDPDLDGVGCSVAYAEFLTKNGRPAVAGIIGRAQVEAEYVLDRFKIEPLLEILDTKDYSEIILVDASHLSFFEGKLVPEKVIEIIDHRKVNEVDKFPKAKIQIELVGSAATLVAEKFIQNKIDISKNSAILLCSAIISNTLNFHSNNCTERDVSAFKDMNKIAQLSDDYWRELFLAKSDLTGTKLDDRIKSDYATFAIANHNFCIAQIEIIGARDLINNREEEIVRGLEKLGQELKTDEVFANVLDLESHEKFTVSSNLETQKLLEEVFGYKFNGHIACDDKKIMRKQIVSMLKDYLEK